MSAKTRNSVEELVVEVVVRLSSPPAWTTVDRPLQSCRLALRVRVGVVVVKKAPHGAFRLSGVLYPMTKSGV